MHRRFVIYNTRDITWEEEAYGRGWHAGAQAERYASNPYRNNQYAGPDAAKMSQEWERGYKAGESAAKVRRGYFKGEIRKHGLRYQPAAQHDFRSERGFVAKVYSSTGGIVAESPPFIDEKKARYWMSERIEKAIKMGYRVRGQVMAGFFDPWQLEQHA